MILVHHLREAPPFVINADLVETIEATPDTHVTLTTGKRVIVRETPAEIVALVIEYRRRCAATPRIVER
jgi:flagellar protein FlbD